MIGWVKVTIFNSDGAMYAYVPGVSQFDPFPYVIQINWAENNRSRTRHAWRTWATQAIGAELYDRFHCNFSVKRLLPATLCMLAHSQLLWD